MTYNNLIKELKAGKYQPVYFLMGEESYFIDAISDYFEHQILHEDEKSFNLHIVYGQDTTLETIISLARRFPMMSHYQVVIVKEAQQLVTLEGLEHYIGSPMPSTLLVFCYKYRKLDKRNKLTSLIAEKCTVFESDRLREDKVPVWIETFLEEKDYQIEPKASWLLVDFLGNDLQKIANELNKLLLLVSDHQNMITSVLVEKGIGISKDYNNFELTKAVASKDIIKANRIIHYFERNPRKNPIGLTISTLFYFFSKVLLYHGITDKSRAKLAKEMGVNPYFIPEYQLASKTYSQMKTREIISLLREYDVKSKGLGSIAPDGELLKELIFKILH